jgi:hypothetical protein
MARFPKYQPSEDHRRQVLTMSGFGIQQEEIARLIDCDAKTLRKYYRRELDTGATEANLRVAQSLYNMAVREKVPAAAIWWTKARMGWKEAQDLNVGGNGQPVVYEFCWRDELAQAPPVPKPLPEPPVIEAAAEPADAEDDNEPEVIWQEAAD